MRPSVCICLLTYNRLDYARETLIALFDNLVPFVDDRDSGLVCLHIADDGSPAGYVDSLVRLASEALPSEAITTSRTLRQGYGANVNYAMRVIHSLGGVKYVLPVEDDWKLKQTLDLRYLMGILDAYEAEGSGARLGCIRLGYLGWYGDLVGRLIRVAGDAFLELDPACSDMYVFSGHPRLETVAWEKRAGDWPEGLNPGETELACNRNIWLRTGVLWPLDMTRTSGDIFSSFGDIPSYDKDSGVLGVTR